ncbi:hypothetical protein, partial [Burkholderia sp. Ac-20384]|uniref:hypothetical protein n=1 Tax=Burkholderia sp. Ac-20384 TaxID=2703902 RepID=UPI0019812BF7
MVAACALLPYRHGVRQALPALPALRGTRLLHGPRAVQRLLARSGGAKHRAQVVPPACATAHPRA